MDPLIRMIADELPVGVWVARAPSGELIYANRTFAEILGTSAREDVAKGEYAGPYGICTREGVPYPEERMPFVQALHAGHTVTIEDIVIHRHDGRKVYIRAWAKPLRGESGAIEMVVIAFSDITPQVIAEQAREESEEHLRRMQRMESVGTLAGGIAHDFNNLLASIQLLASMLAQGERKASRRADLLRILEASCSAERLTGALLDFARQSRHPRQPVSVHAVVDRLHDLLGRTLDHRHRLELDLQAAEHTVLGDGGQLEQVLLNLVLNARDAMPDGGRIRVHTRDAVVDPQEAVRRPPLRPGRAIILEITDQGPGIPKALRTRVFEPYFTTRPDRARPGAGLGLAMVDGIVASHQGVVEVADSEEGACLRVTLPTSDARPRAAVAPSSAVVEGTGHILVIDDEPLIRESCGVALCALGYEVTVAGSGEEAAERVAEAPGAFALVLLDLHMPGWTGRQTLLALRELEPRLPVVLSTGYALDDHVRALQDLGVQAVLTKPYRLSQLSQVVARALTGGETASGGRRP